MPLGLYVHVPFCAAICNYCNFNRGLFDAALKERYVTAVLIRDLSRRRRRRRPTRSSSAAARRRCSSPTRLARIIDACRDALRRRADAEVTLEANPETVNAGAADRVPRAGVNRLSFGVQSFRDDELQRLSRLHSADARGEAVAAWRGTPGSTTSRST